MERGSRSRGRKGNAGVGTVGNSKQRDLGRPHLEALKEGREYAMKLQGGKLFQVLEQRLQRP